jgi:hypothetical protein
MVSGEIEKRTVEGALAFRTAAFSEPKPVEGSLDESVDSIVSAEDCRWRVVK